MIIRNTPAKYPVKCIQSLGYLHNETANIYTHLIPGLLCLVVITSAIFGVEYYCYTLQLTTYSTTTWKDHLALLLFLVGCACCLGMSGTYHCLKCHSQSVAIFGNKLDYLGIVVLIESSMVSMIYYGLYEDPMLQIIFMSITSLIGFVCGVFCLQPKFREPKWRPIRATIFVCYGLSGVLPVLTGLYKYGVEYCLKRGQLKYILLEAIFYIAGAMIYAARIPEKFSPGKFDIWGHSHQIFHVFVVIAACCHGRALLGAYDYTHRMMI
jgi:adiponectin receptor